MTERTTNSPSSQEGSTISAPGLDGITAGLLTARATRSAQIALIRRFYQQHPLQVNDAGTPLLTKYLPDDQEFVEESILDNREEISDTVLEQARRSGIPWDTGQQALAVKAAIAGAKRLVALGAFLKQNGLSMLEINCGSRAKPDVRRINLQDINVATQIAANTVTAGFGQQIALVSAKADPGEEDDLDAIGSWRAETLGQYR